MNVARLTDIWHGSLRFEDSIRFTEFIYSESGFVYRSLYMSFKGKLRREKLREQGCSTAFAFFMLA